LLYSRDSQIFFSEEPLVPRSENEGSARKLAENFKNKKGLRVRGMHSYLRFKLIS
jgi:hypothetical protein